MNRAVASTTFLVFLGMPVFLLATDEPSALLFLLVIGVSISVFPIVSVLILTGIFQVYFAVGLWLYASFTQTQYSKKGFIVLLVLALLLSAAVSLVFTFD